MKLPRILTVRQAVTLAIAAAVIGVFIALFGPMAVSVLFAGAFAALGYAAVLKWAPEYVEPESDAD